jgi:hypothetical protein
MSYHRVAADSILAGKEPSLSEAMRRLSRPQQTGVAMVKRANDLSQTSDFWVIGMPSLLSSFGATAARASELSGFSVAVQLRDQPRLDS